MQFNHAERSAMRNALALSSHESAPLEVAWAASALAPASHLRFVHTEVRESGREARWLVIALVAESGLLVIDATEPNQGWDGDSAPLNRLPEKFSAEIIASDRLRSIEVVSVREVRVPFNPAATRLEVQWALTIDGRAEPVVFPLTPESASEKVAELARAIGREIAGDLLQLPDLG